MTLNIINNTNKISNKPKLKKSLLLHYSIFSDTTALKHSKPVLNIKPWSKQDWIEYFSVCGAVLALGLAISPSIGLGIAIGIANLIIKIIIISNLDNILSRSENSNSKYSNLLALHPYYVSFGGPILEECFFRGLLQPLLLSLISHLAPSLASTIFLSSGVSIAAIIAISITAIGFGLIHLLNSHPNSDIQAITCTISGLIYGLISLQYGLAATVAAHITNNMIVTICVALNLTDKIDNINIEQIETELGARPQLALA